MSWREQLTDAITQARPQCIECGNTRITVEYRPDLREFIPVSHHWAANGPADSCPVLAGGVAAWLAHEDLWAALEPWLGRSDYGEICWSRRQLAEAAS